MNIDLYYVEGISRIDTPSFNTKNHIGTIQDQEDFFLTKKVKTVEIAFYPPHYRDQIKFDESDLVITDNVNYLSFEFGNKTYYYFIEKINYTSTGVILLDISMDVIQTYMFDIYISSGIIERKFINRWNGVNPFGQNKINRSYLRENVSDGLFQLEDYHVIDMPRNRMMIVAKQVEADREKAAVTEMIDTGGVWSEIVYPSDIGFIPLIPQDIKYGEDIYSGVDTGILMYSVATNPKLSELFIIPFEGLGGVVYRNGRIEIDNTTYFDVPTAGVIQLKYTSKSSLSEYLNVKTAQFNNNQNVVDFPVTYTKNVSLGVEFNPVYMPVLFDENYIRLYFGSRSSLTSYPLYESEVSSIKCKYYASFITGARFYYMYSTLDGEVDKKRTLVSDIEPIKFDLISDTYAQFNATNKYRWLQAVGGAVTNLGLLFTSVGIKSAFAANDIAKIASSSLTPKRRQLSKKGMRAIESIQRQQRDAIPSNIETGLESLAPITSTLIKEANMRYAPDTIKQSGSMNDLPSFAFQLVQITEKVNDYEQCAQYYHRNGYLVNQYVTQVSNIFNSVKNRYYFDMLKMSIPEVHLHNVIEDEDTIALIEERLEEGLRLWNIKNNDVIMGDFTYDNVEYDYLS